MSDLTTPVASSIALPPAAAPPSVNAPGTAKPAAFCHVMDDKQFRPRPKPPTGEGERQEDAATGNDLPEKDREKQIDPALAWLFGAPTVPIPVPTPPPATTTAPPAILEAAPDIAPDVLIASPGLPEAKPVTIDPQANCDVVIAKPRMFTLPIAAPIDQPEEAQQQPIKLPIAAPIDQPEEARQQPIKLPLLQPQLPADRGATPPPPAAIALPALFALAMGADRTTREDDSISSLTPATTTPLSQPATTVPIAPMGDAQRQTLDMGRQDWPQKMIDHIEALRDNANANDTSIRLKPEAHGQRADHVDQAQGRRQQPGAAGGAPPGAQRGRLLHGGAG